MRSYAIAVSLACLLACSRGSIDTKEAVRQGVIDYLAGKNLNVASMNVDVTSVSFKENEADATVAIVAKGGGGTPVTFNYQLERKGNRWVVKPHAPGQNPHNGMGGLDSGAPGQNPHGGAMPPAGEMPPGHPTVPQK